MEGTSNDKSEETKKTASPLRCDNGDQDDWKGGDRSNENLPDP